MNLRSGTAIASGSQVPSSASTRSSKNLAAKSLLDPIIEDYVSTSSSEESNTMSSMENLLRGIELERPTTSSVDLLGNPTTLLVSRYTNEHCGHVYTSDSHEFAVWDSSHGETVNLRMVVEVTDHGDHYMDSKGFKFLKTTRPNEMYKWGNLVLGTRAASEPQRASRPSVSTQTNEYSSRSHSQHHLLRHSYIQWGNQGLQQEVQLLLSLWQLKCPSHTVRN